jgi:hypothetical protein
MKLEINRICSQVARERKLIKKALGTAPSGFFGSPVIL